MEAVAQIEAGQQTDTAWRYRLDEMAWRDLVETLKHDSLPFVGLWCDGTDVHALFMPHGVQPLAATLALDEGRYPALSPARSVSSLYERMIFDLYGAEAMWGTDVRPLVDHDVWANSTPLAQVPGPAGDNKGMLTFQPSEAMLATHGLTAGRGPATGGYGTPLHVAMVYDGETILHAETVSGYAHRGMVQRWHNCRVEDANRLSGRYAAGSSAAHQAAFCQAVEQACGVQVGQEVSQLRLVVLELERTLQHLLTLSRIARLAGARLVASRCMWFRESLLAKAAPIIGSRLLMDHCVPGGVNLKDTAGMGELCQQLADMAEELYPPLKALWHSYPGLSARLAGLAVVESSLLERVGLDGPVARAGGGECDYRRDIRAYDGLWQFSGGRHDGTAEDRATILMEEVGESLRIIKALGPRIGLSAGGRTELSYEEGEGLGMAEGPWGAVLYWVRLKNGRVDQVFMRDPAYSALMAFEAVLPGQRGADLALIRESLGVNAAALDG